MTTITPIQAQNNGITGTDVAITAGGTALGAAAGVITGYNLKPTADQFVKQAISFADDGMTIAECSLITAIRNLTKGENKDFVIAQARNFGVEITDEVNTDDIIKVIKQKISTAKENINSDANKTHLKALFDSMDDATKNQLKPFYRKGNMLKWGAIGAGVAALLTAGILFFTKDNNNKTNQA